MANSFGGFGFFVIGYAATAIGSRTKFLFWTKGVVF